ncbi:unnamed protein product [Echinostoma caproni]|uniref:RabBD domain-containing protein n=1 Tax=Echinostoma caproni TaxID=27848 RepID=A0A183API8_9TREM|nr:unnamed protein product [Echinostoma caproni]
MEPGSPARIQTPEPLASLSNVNTRSYARGAAATHAPNSTVTSVTERPLTQSASRGPPNPRLLRHLDADERQHLKQALAEIHERRASGEHPGFSSPEEAPTFPVEPSCNIEQKVSSGVNWRDVWSAAIDRRSRACIVSVNVRSVLNK